MSTAPEQKLDLTKAAFAQALKTGDVITEGPNKGWIYCEGENVKPFLVAPKDSGVMKWRDAMEFAAREKMQLSTREQLHAMYEARNTGALNGTFNVSGSDPSGWYWSATQYCVGHYYWQRIRDGYVSSDTEINFRSVRCVRPYTPA